jgi:hypothetical protein
MRYPYCLYLGLPQIRNTPQGLGNEGVIEQSTTFVRCNCSPDAEVIRVVFWRNYQIPRHAGVWGGGGVRNSVAV